MDPEERGRVVAARGRAHEGPDQAWQWLRTEPVDQEPTYGAATQIGAYCSPFKEIGASEQVFSEASIVLHDRVNGSNRELPTVHHRPGAPVITLDLSAEDVDVALMVESRIGAIDPVARWAGDVLALPVSQDDIPTLIRLAITGTLRGASWDLDALYRATGADDRDQLTAAAFLKRVPAKACPDRDDGVEQTPGAADRVRGRGQRGRSCAGNVV
ncbi:hypothetical protein AB0368_05640 [Actinoplanes sp. NPDC051475]|uniref:hypothetical protein n=1 Tax=Actinoplanes sp. NPDC051475 TaxID=3157225 RepID=UPI00344D06B0